MTIPLAKEAIKAIVHQVERECGEVPQGRAQNAIYRIGQLAKLALHEIDGSCRECMGSGLVTHPLWQRFHATFEPPYGDQAEMDEWWADEGYPGTRPPEEIPCPTCKRRAVIEQIEAGARA